MHNRWSWLAAPSTAVILSLQACAPTNPDTLRTDPGRTLRFEVPLDYQTVYANEQRAFLKCMTGLSLSSVRMTYAIQPRIDTARRTASIIYIHNGAWRDYWAVLDLRANETGTVVDVSTTSHTLMDGFLQIVGKWAAGSDECPRIVPVGRAYPLVE
jgi:hypothetical protein